MLLAIFLGFCGVVSGGLVWFRLKNTCKLKSHDATSHHQVYRHNEESCRKDHHDKLITSVQFNDDELEEEIDKELLDSIPKDKSIYLPIIEESEDDELNIVEVAKIDMSLYSI